jgi:hypothetical protein
VRCASSIRLVIARPVAAGVVAQYREAAANGYEVDVNTARTIVQAEVSSRASAAGM